MESSDEVAPEGWYPDPWRQQEWRHWGPSTGWRLTHEAGAVTARTSDPEEPGPRRWPRLVLVAGSLTLLAVSILIASAGSRPEWLVGRPLPAAPALPPGATLVQDFDGSDSDAGWIGLRGSTFTTRSSDRETAAFYATEFPAEQGWSAVDDDVLGHGSVTYRCRARMVESAGDWESVLLVTNAMAPGRALVLRADTSEASWPLDGRPATMEGCSHALAWVDSSAVDWVHAE